MASLVFSTKQVFVRTGLLLKPLTSETSHHTSHHCRKLGESQSPVSSTSPYPPKTGLAPQGPQLGVLWAEQDRAGLSVVWPRDADSSLGPGVFSGPRSVPRVPAPPS